MPKLIKLHGGAADFANDAFVVATEEEGIPASGNVILTLAQFKDEGQALVDAGRSVGVLLQPDEAVEDIRNGGETVGNRVDDAVDDVRDGIDDAREELGE